MPGFNQSGPEGQGPASGRGRGMCQRTDYSAFSGVGRGRGRGMGMGQGAGQGGGRGVQPSTMKSGGSVDELSTLKAQYESARKMIEELEKKIAAMEGQQK